MKSSLRTVIPALTLVLLMTGSAWGQSRIATVDLRKLFDNYWKTKQADAALKDRKADIDKEYKTLVDEWKKAKDDYQTLLNEANNQTLSLEERDKQKKSAEDKFKQIKECEDAITQYQRSAQTTIEEQKKRMISSIVDEIRTTVSGKAKAGGYMLVFNTTAEDASGTPVVMFTSNENDLTEAVLSQLNAGAPADAAKADDTKPDAKDDKKKGKK